MVFAALQQLDCIVDHNRGFQGPGTRGVLIAPFPSVERWALRAVTSIENCVVEAVKSTQYCAAEGVLSNEHCAVLGP